MLKRITSDKGLSDIRVRALLIEARSTLRKYIQPSWDTHSPHLFEEDMLSLLPSQQSQVIPSPMAAPFAPVDDERERLDIRAASKALVWRTEIFGARADIKAAQARRRYAQKKLSAARTTMAETSSLDDNNDANLRAKRARMAKPTRYKGKLSIG